MNAKVRPHVIALIENWNPRIGHPASKLPFQGTMNALMHLYKAEPELFDVKQKPGPKKKKAADEGAGPDTEPDEG